MQYVILARKGAVLEKFQSPNGENGNAIKIPRNI